MLDKCILDRVTSDNPGILKFKPALLLFVVLEVVLAL
tara:strand:- start:272 stop:382 length:111 start_codon:yes stop_codon:yes gene_type:complete